MLSAFWQPRMERQCGQPWTLPAADADRVPIPGDDPSAAGIQTYGSHPQPDFPMAPLKQTAEGKLPFLATK